MTLPTVVERIRKHGGIKEVHVIPTRGRNQRLRGWHNVVICVDGTRIGLTRDDELAILSLPPRSLAPENVAHSD